MIVCVSAVQPLTFRMRTVRANLGNMGPRLYLDALVSKALRNLTHKDVKTNLGHFDFTHLLNSLGGRMTDPGVEMPS